GRPVRIDSDERSGRSHLRTDAADGAASETDLPDSVVEHEKRRPWRGCGVDDARARGRGESSLSGHWRDFRTRIGPSRHDGPRLRLVLHCNGGAGVLEAHAELPGRALRADEDCGEYDAAKFASPGRYHRGRPFCTRAIAG